MMLTKVVVETGENRREVIRSAVALLGDSFISRIKEAQSILIKVNLVHHENQLASTHVDAVRGLIDEIRPHSRANILIGDASYRGTKAAFRNFGYERLEEEYENVFLKDLNDDAWVDGYTLLEDNSKNPIRRSKIASEADVKISLTPMKTHRDTGVSLSIKNWTVGTWIVPSRISATGRVWARWPWLHEQGENSHHASIMELYRQLPCDFSIIDGIVAMEGDGPTRGNAIEMGVVLAGGDAVAVDAVGAMLMGIDPSEIKYLSMCAEEGLGIIDLAKIDVPPMLVTELSRQFERSR